MKVIIEVIEISEGYRGASKNGCFILKNDECEPVQEGWITEEQFKELYREFERKGYPNCLSYAKERGWIKPSKTAKKKFEEMCNEAIVISESNRNLVSHYHKIITVAKEAIAEAEKK
jgi:hypothetical protein